MDTGDKKSAARGVSGAGRTGPGRCGAAWGRKICRQWSKASPSQAHQSRSEAQEPRSMPTGNPCTCPAAAAVAAAPAGRLGPRRAGPSTLHHRCLRRWRDTRAHPEDVIGAYDQLSRVRQQVMMMGTKPVTHCSPRGMTRWSSPKTAPTCVYLVGLRRELLRGVVVGVVVDRLVEPVREPVGQRILQQLATAMPRARSLRVPLRGAAIQAAWTSSLRSGKSRRACRRTTSARDRPGHRRSRCTRSGS